ncbi:MAG TPA: hypothetical protein EYQ50_07295 [Verrucomicrobiales bacterium]|nr:hypothetical protein [Verrucomicrobiales bacterium]
MSDGPLAAIFERVMGCSAVPMAVTGIDIKLFQFIKLGQRIRQRASDFAAENFVEILTVVQTSRAFQRCKEKTHRRRLFEKWTVPLEISPPRSGLKDGSAHPHLNPVTVGEFGAGMSVTSLIQKIRNGLKKLVICLRVS